MACGNVWVLDASALIAFKRTDPLHRGTDTPRAERPRERSPRHSRHARSGPTAQPCTRRSVLDGPPATSLVVVTAVTVDEVLP